MTVGDFLSAAVDPFMIIVWKRTVSSQPQPVSRWWGIVYQGTSEDVPDLIKIIPMEFFQIVEFNRVHIYLEL